MTPIADLYHPGDREKPQQLPAMTAITANLVILVITEKYEQAAAAATGVRGGRERLLAAVAVAVSSVPMQVWWKRGCVWLVQCRGLFSGGF